MRSAINDFALANRIYRNATVTFYTVVAGVKTANKITLYADETSSTVLANPQHLDVDGKLLQPIYSDTPTIATISGLTIPDHDTGVMYPELTPVWIYDIAGFVSGKPTNSQIILRVPLLRATTFDVDLLLSRGAASAAATASTAFNVAKNGTNFGTMTFGIGATVAVFAAAIPPAFSAGDVFSVTAPASADATLADIGFIIAGYATP